MTFGGDVVGQNYIDFNNLTKEAENISEISAKDAKVYHFGCFLKKLENLPENVIIEACENDMNKIEIVNNYLSYYDEIINKYKKEQPQLPLCNSVVYTNRIKKKLGGNL